MKHFLLQKKFLFILLGCLPALMTGCAKPTSAQAPAEAPSLTVTAVPTSGPAEALQEILSPTPEPTVTSTPVPTATLTPTPTPEPTATPTPTMAPKDYPVYNQVLFYEEEPENTLDYTVSAALLVNITENEVLYSYNALEQIYPASITKLVTALTVFDMTEDFTATVSVSKTAVTPVIPSAKMCGFQAGDRILLSDLLGCMLIYSGNDTSVAVAEHFCGTEEAFVEEMNRIAVENGLLVSNFCNSHGLPDDNHVTSAYDIYLIMQKLFNFDEFLGIIESGSIKVDVLRGESLKTYTFSSTNQFLTGVYQFPEGLTLLGGKTGTTNKAGCCLTLYAKDQNGNCYIAEIFGAESYETLYPCMIQLLGIISEE